MSRVSAARLRSEAAAPRSSPGRALPPGGPSPRSDRRPRAWRWLRLALLALIWGGLAGGALLLVFLWDLPSAGDAIARERRPSVTLQTTDGGLLATQGDLYGEILRLRDIPPHLPAAVLAIEDRRFREHFGLDPVGIARALWRNLAAGDVVQGGSTLTQQLAKNLFLTPERTFRRKVQEAILALWLERRFSKDALLEIYLNRVYLGAGAWGVDAAARVYFGTSARRVNLWQAAVIAGLPKAPSRSNPRANPEGAMARARVVLEAMRDTGAIAEAQFDAAREAMRIPPRPSRQGGWFADWIFEDVPGKFPDSRDLVIRTTLDRRWQDAVEARLAALLDRHGGAARVGEGAVVVLDARSGAVRAMAGGRDFARSPFNRAVHARRQPGSTFKAFVFLAAMERGVSPQDAVSDAPVRLGGWSPSNGTWRPRGSLSVEDAFAHSVNTAAVRVMQQGGGPRAVAAAARRLGVEGRFGRDASVALGTGEVGLLDMTAAFATLANGGRLVTPYGMGAIEGVRLAPPAMPAVVDPEVAARMRRMMLAVTARGTGRLAAVPGIPTGGKTGTTQDHRDAWFVGWAQLPEGLFAIGIWLGNDRNEPMEDVRGSTLPARLFREVVEGFRAGG